MAVSTEQQRVYNTGRKAGLNDAQAKIITAQATLESGHFKSNVYKTDNNIFGMKMPSQRSKKYIERPSTIIKVSEGSTPYAHYSSLENSVLDLLEWHKAKRTDWSKLNTPLQYATYLKSKGYYGEEKGVSYEQSILNYSKIINSFVKKFGGIKYVAPVAGVLFFAAITLFYFYSQNKIKF